MNFMARAVPTPAALRPAPAQGMIQRCGGISCPPGTCDHSDDPADAVHRSAEAGAAPVTNRVPASVLRVLDTPGSPLDASVRAAMESHLGHHFGHVRVHTDAEAARSAEVIQAHAFTFGSHVVMGAGRFQPHTAAGRRLIAHELTHVIQQAGTSGPASSISDPGDPSEQEAEASAQVAELRKAPAPVESPQALAVSRQVSESSTPSSAAPDAGAPPAEVPAAGAADAGVADGGLADAGAPPPCRVDVRATHIGGALAGAPVWHTFIVTRDTAGQEWYFRGGPGGSCAPGTYGSIMSTTGRYLSGTVDWSPGAPSVTVLDGAAACGKESCFSSELSRIDSTCTPYGPTGPNSNSVARTLLTKCGVPGQKPVSITPGWGQTIP